MNKKKFIFLAIAFYVIGFFAQVFSLAIKGSISNDAFCVLAVSSAIPLSISEFSITRLLPRKVAVIKYFLYVHIIGMLISFISICFIAVFSEVKIG